MATMQDIAQMLSLAQRNTQDRNNMVMQQVDRDFQADQAKKDRRMQMLGMATNAAAPYLQEHAGVVGDRMRRDIFGSSEAEPKAQVSGDESGAEAPRNETPENSEPTNSSYMQINPDVEPARVGMDSLDFLMQSTEEPDRVKMTEEFLRKHNRLV